MLSHLISATRCFGLRAALICCALTTTSPLLGQSGSSLFPLVRFQQNSGQDAESGGGSGWEFPSSPDRAVSFTQFQSETPTAVTQNQASQNPSSQTAQSENMASDSSESESRGSGSEATALATPAFTAPSNVPAGEVNQSAPFDDYRLVVPKANFDSSRSRSDRTSYPTLDWSGFLQADTGWLIQDDVNEAAFGRVSPSSGLRRVRLRVDGNVQENTSYVVDLDFAASGHPSFRNVGLTFHDVPALQEVEIGLLKTPFGMDAMTSGRELLFLERQLPFALVPFRQIMLGIRGASHNENLAWGLAAYRMPTDSFGVYEGGDGGIGIAGRLTASPLYAEDGAAVIHFGGGYSLAAPGDDTVRYRIQPGFLSRDPGSNSDDPGTVPVFLDTGPIATDLLNLFNVEVGANAGRLHVSSEVRWSVVSETGGQRLTFPGYYVQASYALTGEQQRYSRRRGVFQRIVPDRPFERNQSSGYGALEMVLGYSNLNLNDGDIAGGRARTLAFGLNWYLTRYARMQFTLQPSRVKKPGFPESSVVMTAVRMQIQF